MEWFGENPPTAIVTGGASGIGRAVCELLAKEGYRVAVADRDKKGAEEVAHHIDGYAFEVDVADEASVIALFDRALETFGGTLDALATPAGIADTTPFMDLTVETFRRVNDVNVVGTFLCIREAAKRMRAGGRICTVASVAGKRGGGLVGDGRVRGEQRRRARADAQRGARARAQRDRRQLRRAGTDAHAHAGRRVQQTRAPPARRVADAARTIRENRARSPKRSRGSCRRARPSSTVRR